MILRTAALFLGMTLLTSIAAANPGAAFGDAYGNTRYETLDQTQICGYTNNPGGDFVRVMASGESFTFNFPAQEGGYMSHYYYGFERYGKVSPTTVGAFKGYVSPFEFHARESLRPAYSKDGPITMTEDFFVVDRTGLLTFTRKLNGVEQFSCRYQRL